MSKEKLIAAAGSALFIVGVLVVVARFLPANIKAAAFGGKSITT